MPKEGDVFSPGSLTNHTRLQTFLQCHVDPLRYQSHFGKPYRSKFKCTTSESSRLVYAMVGKSGSSSARITMQQKFNAEDNSDCRTHDTDPSYHRFSFVRDPFGRFISSFRQELKVRYKAVRGKRPRSDHNGTVRALEAYVETYDGTGAELNHLRMQVPNLMLEWGVPHYDAFYEMEDMEAEFRRLFRDRSPSSNSTSYDNDNENGNENDNDNVTVVKHTHNLRIDTSAIAVETRRKICRLNALDYCCLNYKLPPECRGEVECRWTQRDVLDGVEGMGIEVVSHGTPSTDEGGYRRKGEKRSQYKKRKKEHEALMDAAIRSFED